MRTFLFLISVLFTLLLPGVALAENNNTVILLSWDGMRHDFLDRGNFPALKRMETNGIRAGRLTPVSLSNTFPGHVSLATGAPPEVHGIVDNVFLDKQKGLYAYSSDADWIRAEPIWITAERQGVKAATYFWVGSETDWNGQSASYRMAPFDGGRAESEKVDKMIEWLDLPEDERPRLIMSYWQGADTVAHTRGPDHDAVEKIIAEQDIELARLMKALDDRDLWSTTTLIIVSDHGMTRVTESVEFETALEEANLDVTVTGGGSGQHIHLSNPEDKDAVLTVLKGLPHLNIHQSDEIPGGMRAEDRTGEIVVTTVPPYTLSRADTFLSKALVMLSPVLGWQAGTHGFDPALDDMGGIFLAMGNGVTKGKQIEDVHQLEVAPTVAKLLGIEPPTSAERAPLNLN